jgi:hypothetical protein
MALIALLSQTIENIAFRESKQIFPEYENLTYSNRNRKNGGRAVWVYLQKLVSRRAEKLVCRIQERLWKKM